MGFFRHWIHNLALIAKPLYQIAREISWGLLTHPATVRHHFFLFWDALLAAPAQAIPISTCTYQVFTDERVRETTGVLAQLIGPSHLVLAFLSKQLDSMVCEWQQCLRALAAAAVELTPEALKITLVPAYHCMFHLSNLSCSSLSLEGPSRVQAIHLLFLENLQCFLTSSPVLITATLPPTSSLSNTSSHSCPAAVEVEALRLPRPALSDQPLTDPQLTLFVDGSPLIDRWGNCQATYAVITSTKTVEVNCLLVGSSL